MARGHSLRDKRRRGRELGPLPRLIRRSELDRSVSVVEVCLGLSDLALGFAFELLGFAFELLAAVARQAANGVSNFPFDLASKTLGLIIEAVAVEIVCHL